MKYIVLVFFFFRMDFGIASTYPGNLELVWSDEFNSTEIDFEKWSFRSLGPRQGGIIAKSQVIPTRNGYLKMIGSQNGKGDLLGGMLSTHKSFSIKYGYFETRVKLNRTQSFRAAFWLQSRAIAKKRSPEEGGVEIDVFEYYYSKKNKGLNHALHWGGYEDKHEKVNSRPDFYPKEKWYTFGCVWNPDGYTFFVDGVESWSIKGPVSRIEQYLILSLEILGNARSNHAEQVDDSFLIDYVRVYEYDDELIRSQR